MKKRNLATAMAAAVAVTGVVPAMASANEPTGRAIVEGTLNNDGQKENIIDVALANGKQITTNKSYRDVYNTEFTDETKDDVLKDATTEILSIVDASGDLVRIPATTPAEDAVKLAITTEIKNPTAAQKLAIAQAKADLKETKAEIERLLNLTTTIDGEEVKVYEIDKDATELAFDAVEGMPVYTVTLEANEGTDFDDKTFYFAGMAMEAVVVEPSKEFEPVEVDLSINEETGKATDITTFNKAVYELKTAINEGKITVEKAEDGDNLVLTIYSADEKEELGTYTLLDFKAFKADKYEGFVELTNLKDLSSLDLPELSWAKDDIINALSEGKLQGDERGFRPQDKISRAEFAKMIVTLGDITVGTKQTAKETFTDVDGEWFAPYVATLQTIGIVEGDGNGTFRPYDDITRQEAAVMIAAMKNITEKGGVKTAAKLDNFKSTTGKAIDSTTEFKDDKAIELWADGAVKYLQTVEISRGDENKNFNPANDITRAESVVMITKAKDARAVIAADIEK